MTDKTSSEIRSVIDSQDIGKLEKLARENLDRSLEKLSNHAQHRLYSARRNALATARNQSQPASPTARWWHPLQWAHWRRPLGSLAMVSVILGAVFYFQFFDQVPKLDSALERDSEILLGEDELELYENLEFYAWLAEIENG